MKEAAGEANMTVITIVLIGVVAAVGAIFIPRVLENMKLRSCCTDALGGTWNKDTGKCVFVYDGKNREETISGLKKNYPTTCGIE